MGIHLQKKFFQLSAALKQSSVDPSVVPKWGPLIQLTMLYTASVA